MTAPYVPQPTESLRHEADELMTISTSVVICAYTEKRWDQLVAAVESVEAQNEPVGQIVLVIDHNDGLLGLAAERWPTLTVVANGGPQGLSAARNTGIEASSGDIVLFLDDDAVADPDWAGLLTAPYADPDHLGGRRFRAAGVAATAATWWPREFGWVVGCSYRGQPTSVSRVRNLMGCNMSRTPVGAAGGRWFRHRPGPYAGQPAGLRGDRAVHPGRGPLSAGSLPARTSGRRAPCRAGRTCVVALLPRPLPR